MSERESHIYMARAYLHQAAVVRLQGYHPGWHATLLRWAADRRIRAAKKPESPAQLELFA